MSKDKSCFMFKSLILFTFASFMISVLYVFFYVPYIKLQYIEMGIQNSYESISVLWIMLPSLILLVIMNTKKFITYLLRNSQNDKSARKISNKWTDNLIKKQNRLLWEQRVVIKWLHIKEQSTFCWLFFLLVKQNSRSHWKHCNDLSSTSNYVRWYFVDKFGNKKWKLKKSYPFKMIVLICLLLSYFIYQNKLNSFTLESREHSLREFGHLWEVTTIIQEIKIDGYIMSGYITSKNRYGLAFFAPNAHGKYDLQTAINSHNNELLFKNHIINNKRYTFLWANKTDLDYAEIIYKSDEK